MKVAAITLRFLTIKRKMIKVRCEVKTEQKVRDNF